MKVNGQWVNCVHNCSLYSFIPIPLELYRCLGHALKMASGLNMNFRIRLSLCSQFELTVVFRAFRLIKRRYSRYLVCATLTVLYTLFSD